MIFLNLKHFILKVSTRIPGENLVLCSVSPVKSLALVSWCSWFCVGFVFYCFFSTVIIENNFFIIFFYAMLFMIHLGTSGLTVFVVIPPLTVMLITVLWNCSWPCIFNLYLWQASTWFFKIAGTLFGKALRLLLFTEEDLLNFLSTMAHHQISVCAYWSSALLIQACDVRLKLVSLRLIIVPQNWIWRLIWRTYYDLSGVIYIWYRGLPTVLVW